MTVVSRLHEKESTLVMYEVTVLFTLDMRKKL